ncbi:MAG: long-chain fatty acid--CoA ligase [Clostridia bacterium]|nr:long-chain fatty acid--CoA ligase [Clostridia bacterium]
MLSLFKGADIVFCSEQFNPLSLIEMIKKEGITVMGGTPTLLSTVSVFVKEDDELPLKTIAISGECMTEAAAKKIQKAFNKAKIYSVYVLTEASPRVSYLPPDLFLKHPTSVGIPLKSVRMKIVDECDNELPDNEVGELLVMGDNVMIGYYCDNAKTYKAKRNGWLHTGDLAYKDKNGLYYIKGRKVKSILTKATSTVQAFPQERR